MLKSDYWEFRVRSVREYVLNYGITAVFLENGGEVGSGTQLERGSIKTDDIKSDRKGL